MGAEDAIWAEHEAAVKDILARASGAMGGLMPGAMVFGEHMGYLSRKQVETAGKLGKKRDDLMDRFGPETTRMRRTCGLPEN